VRAKLPMGPAYSAVRAPPPIMQEDNSASPDFGATWRQFLQHFGHIVRGSLAPQSSDRATKVDTRTSVNYSCYMIETNLPAPAQPGDGLAAVVALRRLADRLEDAEVERALRTGWSWSQVAEALGVTRQAVHKKHAKRLNSSGIVPRRRDGEE